MNTVYDERCINKAIILSMLTYFCQDHYMFEIQEHVEFFYIDNFLFKYKYMHVY